MDSLIRPAAVTVTRAAYGDKMSNIQMTPGGAAFRTNSLTERTDGSGDVQPGRGHAPDGGTDGAGVLQGARTGWR